MALPHLRVVHRNDRKTCHDADVPPNSHTSDLIDPNLPSLSMACDHISHIHSPNTQSNRAAATSPQWGAKPQCLPNFKSLGAWSSQRAL